MPRGQRQLGRPRPRYYDNIKTDLGVTECESGFDLTDWGYGIVAGFCEHGNGLSYFSTYWDNTGWSKSHCAVGKQKLFIFISWMHIQMVLAVCNKCWRWVCFSYCTVTFWSPCIIDFQLLNKGQRILYDFTTAFILDELWKNTKTLNIRQEY
jgi:hypothetical protein